MRIGSSRHFFLILRWPPPGSHAAKAFAVEARSVSWLGHVSLDTTNIYAAKIAKRSHSLEDSFEHLKTGENGGHAKP
jgi:hypothetical protein